MSQSQPKKSNGKGPSRRGAQTAKRPGVPPELDASAEAAALIGELWQPAPREQPGVADEVAREVRRRLGDEHHGWEARRVRHARAALDRYLARDGDAAASATTMPALLAAAHNGTMPLALTFGGQSATGYWDELVTVARASPAARRFAAQVSERLVTAVAAMPAAEHAYFTAGIDVARWLADSASRPSDPYVNGVVSQPLTFVTQVAQYLWLLESGYDRSELWTGVRAIAGHSQGVMAALLVAETWGSSDVTRRAGDYALYLLYQALRMRQTYVAPAVSPQVLADAEKAGAGTPMPMASVTGLDGEALRAMIARLGLDLHVGLDNGRVRKVVSGHPGDLEVLRRALVDDYAEKKKAKGAGRHAGAVSAGDFAYLPFAGAYHSPFMAPGVGAVLDDCRRLGFTIERAALALPVIDNATGTDLREAADVLERVVRLQFVEPVAWGTNTRALHERGARAVLDFGPGEGVFKMTAASLRGYGVAVLGLATEAGRAAALRLDRAPVPPPAYSAFAPELVETADGKLRVDNRYTRFTGRAPVILPGMTPTTADADIVVAAANAGFTSELAGGGQVTAAVLRRRVAEIARGLAPGAGVVLNALYLDPYLWKLQLGEDRLVLRLRDEGYPLIGVTVSAGIPPVEESVALLRELDAHGLWLNSFKPGTDEQVTQVLAIADAAPELTFTMQIEGGKAGGHHSWEDLHDLLTRHYDAVRKRPNLLLAVGGGIAGEAQATAYLTGTWARAHGLPDMPVDAVFIGTLAMATREAKTSQAVKQALVAAAGTTAWVLDGTVGGGVTSGRSQLDASIYYLDNDASRAGRLLDALARDPDSIPGRKAEIVAALAKTAKPYFGDVEAMTYAALLARAVELMAIGEGGAYEDGRWLDQSHRRRFLELVRMAEARLHGGETPFASLVQSDAELDLPEAILARLATAYPGAATTGVHPQDARAFVEICRGPGKPVNFVPVIDRDVRRWYKSDALWQSHHPRYTAAACLVLPGPDAVTGVVRADEPVAELLSRFEAHASSTLKAAGVPNRKAAWAMERRRVPTGGAAAQGVLRCDDAAAAAPAAWRGRIAELGTGPLAAAFAVAEGVLESAALAGEVRIVSNPLIRLLAPVAGHALRWRTGAAGELCELVYEDAGGRTCARARLGAGDGGRFSLGATLVATPAIQAGADVELDLALDWVEDAERGRLVWRHDDYVGAQRDFYARLLFGEVLEGVEPFATARDTVTVTRQSVASFALATGDDSQGVLETGAPAQAPLAMAFALAWRSIYRAFAGARPNVVGLLHEDNAVTAEVGWPAREGETLATEARIESLETLAAGRRIVVAAEIRRDGELVATVKSTFFIRGVVAAAAGGLERRARFAQDVTLADTAARALLLEQAWLAVSDPDAVKVGEELQIVCEHFVEEQGGGASRFAAEGELRVRGKVVGRVRLLPEHAPPGCRRHPVAELCAVLGGRGDEVKLAAARQLGSKRIAAPGDMLGYARASGDFNPLHLTPAVARFAGLPGPIVHGMWTAAAALHRAVRLAADGEASRLREVETRFLAPVDPGTPIRVRLRQTGMRRGARLIELDAVAHQGGVEKPVLSGRAIVAPPRTAYVFPGQGLQRVGMGMQSYARSPAARAVWDEADAACRERLGFSILRVVRENPRELAVGDKLLKHPNGVLFLTQFTQVAMAVMAIAQVRELEERGAYNPEALFCGHSVGEYSALAAIGGVMPVPGLVVIVYQRGATMDALVERDAQGRSPYAMGVIRPHQARLDEDQAKALVAEIARATGKPLEIVNYNIRGKQYSVTGHVAALAALAERLAGMQRGHRALDAKPAYLTVEGIDVPFHSTLLREGVPLFRETLERVIPREFDCGLLVGRYIPNLVAQRFALVRPFAEAVLAASGSPIVADLLAHWDERRADEVAFARTLLIELLAYQFASPVRWIETQDLLFAPETGLQELVEVGLGEQPVLGNMAQATLATTPYRRRRTRVMHTELHADELLGPTGVVEDDPEPVAVAAPPRRMDAPATISGGAAVAAATGVTAPAAAAPETTPAAAAPAGGVLPSALPDAPPTIGEALKLLLALQCRVRPEQLRDTETIDELLGGNSAKRNQVLADVGGEFGVGAIDGAYELPLAELAQQLAARASGYTAPGKYLGASLDQALGRALGAARYGRAEVIDYLGRAWGLGAGRALAVALRVPLAVRDGASPRGGALSPAPLGAVADRPAAEAWLDNVVVAYARELGIALAKPVARVAATAQVDAGALRELDERLLGRHGVIARVAAVLTAQTGGDERRELRDDPELDKVKARLAQYEREHGEAYEAAIAPLFDADKHVALTAMWAWGRRDVLAAAAALARGAPVDDAALRRLARRLDVAGMRAARSLALVAEREGRLADAERLARLADLAPLAPAFVADFTPSAPAVAVDEKGEWRMSSAPRAGERDAAAFVEAQLESTGHPLRVFGHESGQPVAAYAAALRRAAREGLSFAGRTALVTGASPGAIALEVVKALLAGGARVVLTTSTHTAERLVFYKRLYQEHAAATAELHVVPANQGAFADVDALVRWLATPQQDAVGAPAVVQRAAWLPDLVLPFGALSETAHLGGGVKAQAVLRVLLLGVERLVAAVAGAYRDNAVNDRTCHVVLPLSPNHGVFGGDSVYAESKAALEAVLNKWRSEETAWGRQVTLAGARIGWVRSTGLMSANDLLGAPLEAETGVRTFAPEEMGLLIAALCADDVRRAAAQEPLVADLTGGFSAIRDLNERVARIRAELAEQASERRRGRELRRSLAERLVGAERPGSALVAPRPTFRSEVPVPDDAELPALPALDHLDLGRVVVAVGFGEVSPYGSSRTRWTVERDGALSLEAVVELAWMMGLIRPRQDGTGWEDVKSGAAIADVEVKQRYEAEVLAHSGIRLTDPEIAGFEPKGALAFVDVRLEQDFRFSVASRAEAESLQAADPAHTRVLVEADGGLTVERKRGGTVRMARALRVDRNVAGQVPRGWDAQRYGIPKEICDQVDRVTLFNLIATVEAFAAAGLDPEEIYAYLHPSRVSSSQSSGIGGMQKLARLYRDYYDGKERQTDGLQETLINVIAGYVVQTYLGSYGPMSFPVGACATAAISVQNAVEQILQNEADLVVTGGVDDYGVEGAIGFSDMKATAGTEAMERLGIPARRLSRPNDRRRRGFVEGQGAGAVILCRASVAVELGLPVYGVVAYAGSFSDGIHRSIPAPGIGVLACAAEVPDPDRDPRSACGLAERRARIAEIQAKARELAGLVGEETARHMVREARRFYGHDFYRDDPRVSPLRGALAVLGLTADDVAVVSKHDTSTAANDANENRLHAWLHQKLGRTPDLPLVVISQKSLTGHPKGAAAAWQMVGLLQAMADGVVPGNHSLEDVDPAMAELAPMTFTDTPIVFGRGRLRAGVLTSLGFGHVGAIVVLGHPFLFWRMLAPATRRAYMEKLGARCRAAAHRLQRMVAGHEPFLTLRTKRPFAAKDGTSEQNREEAAMLLDPRARLRAGESTYSVG